MFYLPAQCPHWPSLANGDINSLIRPLDYTNPVFSQEQGLDCVTPWKEACVWTMTLFSLFNSARIRLLTAVRVCLVDISMSNVGRKDRTNAVWARMSRAQLACAVLWALPGMRARYSSQRRSLTTTWSSGYSTTVLNIRFSLSVFFKSSSWYLQKSGAESGQGHDLSYNNDSMNQSISSLPFNFSPTHL